MSSSSRSIAAARARRAGDPAPPVSGGRPGTSIGSHAAFVPQQMPSQYQNNVQPSNVRLSKSQSQMPPPQQPQNGNGLPFSKLSISDAIGLITLRLGRVEQFVMDLENGDSDILSERSNIPENTKIIDSSILTNIINRLDSLEKNTSNQNSTIIASISEELVKTNILVSKNANDLVKVDRDLLEMKDLLKSVITKFDTFINETNEKFSDYETAIADLEKNIVRVDDNDTSNFAAENFISDESESIVSETDNNIMSVDLKNIIKMELANERI